VEEAATVLGSHKNTVRNWLGDGLEAIDDRRPVLIQGAKLKAYLDRRRQRNRSPCGPGRIYCLRCRAPKHPLGKTADYVPITPSSGNLRARCPDCLGAIFRRVRLSRLVEGADPSVNCDLELEPDAQPGK
jgi:hypothetical protein